MIPVFMRGSMRSRTNVNVGRSRSQVRTKKSGASYLGGGGEYNVFFSNLNDWVLFERDLGWTEQQRVGQGVAARMGVWCDLKISSHRQNRTRGRWPPVSNENPHNIIHLIE